MTDPVKPSLSPPIWPPAHAGQQVPKPAAAEENLHAAEQEAASLYYTTTLQSLAASPEHPEKKQAAVASEQKAVQKSFLGRAKDWLWGIFGWGQKQPVSQADQASGIEPEDGETPTANPSERVGAEGAPKLQAPDINDKKRLSQAIATLNRELVNRLKDMAEFEEEMKKSSSNKLDKFIFLQLIHTSIAQKQLKESGSMLSHEHLLQLHKRNQELQKTYYSHLDAIHSDNKARGVIKWINIGLTAVTVGGTAIAFAIGGPGGIFAVGLPLSMLGKGVTTMTEGVLKYKTDRKMGDLIMIKHETKANASHKQDKLSEMQISNTDIAALWRLIRRHLDNQTKAERASFGRNT